jgi:DNA-binding MarR family transcriptional regulator
MGGKLSLSDYRSLAELRYQIRRYLKFSENVAYRARMEPRQHQLLLTIKGLPSGQRPVIGELAERMQIQHHSTVELVNRLESGGFVRRHRSDKDRREVFVALTSKGERVLRQLSLDHSTELRTQGPILVIALKHAMRTAAKTGKNK